MKHRSLPLSAIGICFSKCCLLHFGVLIEKCLERPPSAQWHWVSGSRRRRESTEKTEKNGTDGKPLRFSVCSVLFRLFRTLFSHWLEDDAANVQTSWFTSSCYVQTNRHACTRGARHPANCWSEEF